MHRILRFLKWPARSEHRATKARQRTLGHLGYNHQPFLVEPLEGRVLPSVLPSLSINNVTQVEGNSGTTSFVFTVTLSAVSGAAVTVNYATADGTATTADNDYQAKSGTLTFAPGVTSQTISVSVNGDTKYELNEAFKVNLSGAVNATIATGTDSFGAATNFLVGPDPESVAVGDFNGDGILDLAVANYLSHTVSILLGMGTGSFGAATNFGTGSEPMSVAVGDFNGDGHQDLAVANSGDNNLSILLGTGTGSFGAATNFGVGSSPFSIAVGDFNGDSIQDLAVANANSHTVSILLGMGTGSFGAATNFGTGSEPMSVAVGDFNGDGHQDLAVANEFGNTVSILLGTGTGSFGTRNDCLAGSYPQSVAVGDFNRDGILDLAVPIYGSNNVSILLGTGTGSFGAATSFGAGSEPSSVAVGDFNGDGMLDLAVSNYLSDNVSILLGTGTGSFGTATNFGAGNYPSSVAVGDFNGDGILDLAVANAPNVSILLGTGKGTGGGTIINDDTAPSLSINGGGQEEGDSGTTPLVFTVSLSAVSGATATVHYATADGTSTTADNDYQATSGTLTFAPGVTSQTVTVLINGDYIAEQGEFFLVNLSTPVNATLATSTGQGLIINDDIAVASPYADIDGDKISVRLRGHGTYSLTTDLAGDLRVILTGTDSKSSLTISVKKGKTGDGLTNVALIQSDGDLKSVSAKTSSLVGSGIHIAGYLGSLTLHDIFNANVELSGAGVLAGKLALGKLSVTNTISNALIDITGGQGGIGSVKAGAILNSVIEAGYNPAIPNNLMDGGDFLSGLGIKSVTVKGIHGTPYAFVNSVLAADKVGTVKLASVQQNNGGLAFGVIADGSIGSVLDQLTGWKAAGSIPFNQNETDFHVTISY